MVSVEVKKSKCKMPARLASQGEAGGQNDNTVVMPNLFRHLNEILK